MAEQTARGTLGSSSGATQSATNTTGSGNTIVGRVRDQATAQLNTQKNKATDGLGSVAHAVRDTTQRLRQENHDTVARYVEQAADQIERFSTRLKDRDVGELVNEAQRLARRQPALFVGGAFAVGLLGARFLKSSAQDDDRYTRKYDALARTDIPATPTSVNAYGNQVPPSAGTATAGRAASTADRSSTRSRSTSATPGTDYKPTEGM
jgi:hypothetical protein